MKKKKEEVKEAIPVEWLKNWYRIHCRPLEYVTMINAWRKDNGDDKGDR